MGCVSKIWRAVKRYLANCNLHGMRYLVADDLHWTERVFWLMICALCWWRCLVMVQDSLNGFYNQPVALTVETMYLDWQTEFPAISICLRPHPVPMNIARSLHEKRHGTKIKVPNPWRWLFSSDILKASKQQVAEFEKLTADEIISLYTESIANCPSLLNDCFYRSRKFNCCDEFRPLKTAAGQCYVFNSRHTRSDYKVLQKFIMNKETGIGYIHIGFTPLAFAGGYIYVQVYIHNPLEIPNRVTFSDKEIITKPERVASVYFSMEDVFNDAGLRSIPPKRRGCRFFDEADGIYTSKWYSNNGCSIQIQMEHMLKVCGCVSHLFPYVSGMPVCNYTGLQCLNKQHLEMKAKENFRECLPSCEGVVIKYFQHINQKASQLFKVPQGLHLELFTLPPSRYRRYVLRSLLDLVVAVGSAAGLFLGAGILSIVEIPYWLWLRNDS
ncbi:sodium channel protein Nach [Athalia rosae]|uniref:sodium channel protein Nach n=1 Tax=Athalia rosae TaxID=37344 RepID=UPI00203378A4|nr:sodium channel protein Nach [Athalia rosae]